MVANALPNALREGMAAQKHALNSAWSLSSGYLLFNPDTAAVINDRGHVCYELSNPLWVSPEEDRFVSVGFVPTLMNVARQVMIERLKVIEQAAEAAIV